MPPPGAWREHADALARQHEKLKAEAWEPWQRPPAQETYLRAVDALMENGVVDGPEMRHEASLSPIALLRGWQVDIAVTSGAVRHTLRGKATAYGRGLSLAAGPRILRHGNCGARQRLCERWAGGRH